MHYIYSIFSYFLFCFVFVFCFLFCFLFYFIFFCNSYFVQLFIFFSHCHFSSIFHPHQYIYIYIYINFHLIPFRFLNIFLYIFLNSTVSICSTFHLLPPFLFHLNFHINLFLASLFPIPSKLSTTKMSILYLFLQFCFSFGGFFFIIVPTTFLFLLLVLFVIVDLIVTSHLFIFLVNLYQFISIFMHI